MGLIVDDTQGLRPANPIYSEVIIRALSLLAQERMGDRQIELPWSKFRENGKISFGKVLVEFQRFWREGGND